MSIDFKVFGIPGQDNALYVNLNSGQNVFHFLCDCGYCGLHHLGRGILQDVDLLLFSHMHIDHIAGFDVLFRHLYSRSRPLNIIGPKGITQIIRSRLTGFSWNLVDKSPGEVIVHEKADGKIVSSKYLCREAFKRKHHLAVKDDVGIVYSNKYFSVQAVSLDHNLECSAYSIKEHDSHNINIQKMKEMGLTSGTWCAKLKNNNISDKEDCLIKGSTYKLGDLRKELLEIKKGSHLVYATDFIMSDNTRKKLLPLAKGADYLVMESMYLDKDVDLAKKNYHLTVSESATFGKDAEVKDLVIFHVSDRYDRYALAEMIDKAQSIFSKARFPVHWKTGDVN